MITLITGNPGAGKTLYCVSNLLRDLIGSVVKSVDAGGREVETPRVVFTNINGLLLDHELIDGSDTGGLANWHEWAKPGAVICFDEVQREWKPRANGSKVPKCIEMLETHRHMGVDFIILTQHPGLIDQNIRALVGRHLHVRRFGGMGAAIVYEWDHCSRNLLYSKSLGKKAFPVLQGSFQPL
jgi:zona occludens toxin